LVLKIEFLTDLCVPKKETAYPFTMQLLSVVLPATAIHRNVELVVASSPTASGDGNPV